MISFYFCQDALQQMRRDVAMFTFSFRYRETRVGIIKVGQKASSWLKLGNVDDFNDLRHVWAPLMEENTEQAAEICGGCAIETATNVSI